MSCKICGYCINWRCDEPLHLTGHCIVDRRNTYHETRCDTCTEYQSIRENNKPKKNKKEKKNDPIRKLTTS